MVFQLGFAAVLGGAIGWEREVHGRPAGLRTHVLIVVGCTLMTLLSLRFPGSDQSRIAAQIVTGIGFLGAGSILRRGGEIKGLTTAASVWMVAAIGIGVGLGGDFYALAAVATVFTLVTLGLMDRIFSRVMGSHQMHEVELVLESDAKLSDIFGVLAGAGLEMNGFTKLTAEGETQIVMSVTARETSRLEQAIHALINRDDVKSVNHGAP